MSLFGTSGIRGVFGTEVTLELAVKVGRAVAREAGGRLVIGRDARASGFALENSLASGVLEAGGEVLRIGVAPTPTVALASKMQGCAGAMITASHNPPEYNGIKLFEKGQELSLAGEKKIEKAVAGKQPAPHLVRSFDKRLDGAIESHIQAALSRVDVSKISSRAPKVLVDSANGAGCVASPYALRMAGCRVVSLNCDVSGKFARKLEPNEENLKRTAAFARACGTDFAVAHDGDADRAIILDEKGRMLGLDAQLALVCTELLQEKKGPIVTTVEASLAVRESIQENGGKLIITPVGSRGVAEAMRKSNAIFGGEPCGEYIFQGEPGVPDGISVALKFAEIFAEKGRLSRLASSIASYPMKRSKLACKNKEKAMGVIRKEAKKLGGKLNAIDGVRLDFDDGWLLIRPSGTEPVMRVTCEHKSEKELNELHAKAEALVKKASRG